MEISLLQTDRLSKSYGTFRALHDLTMRVAPGEVVGLLGPNGSGKSTALRSILGFLQPTSGSAQVEGFDCWRESIEVRKRVAYLPGELRLYENMTGRQLVSFLAQLRGDAVTSEVDTLAKRLDIDIDRPLTQLSSGMKRKVALLAVLIPKVPLIILDEPTNTLDPTMRDELLELLLLAKSTGKAVLFSSHVLQEVEAICERVLILRQGELVHEQSMSALRDGRHITAGITGEAPTTDPAGLPLVCKDGKLDLEYRGELSAMLNWLARFQLTNLKIEPLGLSAIYRNYHRS